MAKTASDIVDRALTLIDEIPTSFATAASTETSIRELALEILPEVCRDLVKELPWELKRHLGVDGNLTSSQLDDGESQQAYVKRMFAYVAPTDFWELVEIKLNVWAKPVTEYILINGDGYAKQHNPFTRGGLRNPVVALSTTSTGSNARIECFSGTSYSSTAAVTVTNFKYIRFDNVPDDVGNNWPDEVFDEITKALAIELNIIKSRDAEAATQAEAISNALEQHE